MRLVSFTAETPAAALAQIQQQLGPEAVVLAVRPLASTGLARLWSKQRGVEVLAGIAEEEESISQRDDVGESLIIPDRAGEFGASQSSALRGAPLYDGTDRPHVFIGPPGVGKTTLLCKWLVTAVLTEGRPVRLWRLDGAQANTAELLNVYGEMFGLTVERSWQTPQEAPAQPRSPLDSALEEEIQPKLLLIDLPGVESGDAQALNAARAQLAALPQPRVHLVLNGAYDTAVLSEQFRALASFQPEDLSFTHLDEEKRREKLLSFASGTNCPVRFLSGGQKIPGQFTVLT